MHGGPGAGHDYVDSLADLAVDRPVVLYDQLCCGRSAQFAEECAVLRSGLPPDVRDVLTRYEAIGQFDTGEYLEAVNEFNAGHLCRLEEWPDAVMRSVANLDGNRVYLTMNGPNEFTTIGNLADWDRSGRLGEIRVPTLITCGRHDELGPSCAATLEAGIPDALTVVFEHSAHLAHVEERQPCTSVVGEFLRGHDR